MPLTHVRTFRVRHYECDAYGYVHHANYLIGTGAPTTEYGISRAAVSFVTDPEMLAVEMDIEDPDALAAAVPDDVVQRYAIAGTPDEVRRAARGLRGAEALRASRRLPFSRKASSALRRAISTNCLPPPRWGTRKRTFLPLRSLSQPNNRLLNACPISIAIVKTPAWLSGKSQRWTA